MSWTPETTAHFRRLHAAKNSAQQIADKLNAMGFDWITRNACVGKARRMHLDNGRVPGFPLRNGEHPASAHGGRNTSRPAFVFNGSMPPPSVPERTGQLIDLDTLQCRYPVTGGNPPHLFCTEDKAAGVSYCPRHAAQCFVAPHGRTR